MSRAYTYGPVRAAILCALATREMTSAELAASTGVSRVNASQALQRLADAREVHVPRREGRAHVWACGQAGDKSR